MVRVLIIDDWENNVDKNGPLINRRLGRCWVWRRAIDPGSKYGAVWNSSLKRVETAHRAVWRKVNGDPGEFFVLHKCDNRPCVRPSHLYLGTRQDNSDDKVRRERQSRGSRRPLAKLTEADVRELKKRYAAGERQYDLASIFHVNQSQVSRAIRGKRWKHVAPEDREPFGVSSLEMADEFDRVWMTLRKMLGPIPADAVLSLPDLARKFYRSNWPEGPKIVHGWFGPHLAERTPIYALLLVVAFRIDDWSRVDEWREEVDRRLDAAEKT